MGNKTGDKLGLGDKPKEAGTASQTRWKRQHRRQAEAGRQARRRTQHPSQAGRQDRRQEEDKPREADTASQTRWDKPGDKTGDKRKTRPARRTQHPRPDGRQAGDKRKTRPGRRIQRPSQRGHTRKALRTPTVNCLGIYTYLFIYMYIDALG